MALRASSSVTTIDPASSRRESSHIPGNTDFPPLPSTQLDFQFGNFCADPFSNENCSGDAVCGSAAYTFTSGLIAAITEATPQDNPPPPNAATTEVTSGRS